DETSGSPFTLSAGSNEEGHSCGVSQPTRGPTEPLTSSPALRLGIPTECCVDLQQLFGGFLLQRDCPGEEAWFLPRRTPAVGSLTRFEPQPGNSPRSHVLSASVTSGMPCRRLPWLSAATPL